MKNRHPATTGKKQSIRIARQIDRFQLTRANGLTTFREVETTQNGHTVLVQVVNK